MRLLAVLAALAVLTSGAEAQQLDFKRVSRSGDELLAYRWRDHDKHVHTLAFTLTRGASSAGCCGCSRAAPSAWWWPDRRGPSPEPRPPSKTRGCKRGEPRG